MIKSNGPRSYQAGAKNSFNRLCWQTTAGLCISRAALLAMAFSAAPPAFQRNAPATAQFCALDSWIRHRPSRHAANPARGRDVGTRSACRFVELGRSARMGRLHRHVSAHGLRLLVVALGQPYGSTVLASPERASHGSL